MKRVLEVRLSAGERHGDGDQGKGVWRRIDVDRDTRQDVCWRWIPDSESSRMLEGHDSCGTISMEAGVYEIGEISSCGSPPVYMHDRRWEN